MDDQVKEPLQPEQGAEVVVENKQEEVKKDPSEALTPDHPRFKQVLGENKELKNEINELRDQLKSIETSIAARQQETGSTVLTAEEEAQMSQVDKLLKQRGYVKQDDLTAAERVNRRAFQMDKLTDKYNGSNGYPKFDAGEVIAHARANGFSDDQLEKAYKDLHYDAIVKLEATKISKAQVPDSEKPTGTDKQFESQFTTSHIAKMSDSEWEKNRTTILSRLKQAARNASRFE